MGTDTRNNNRKLRYPVAVIGAGASGLVSVKSCLEENLDVVCFEKTDNIAGLWAFREEVIDGVASVMRSTIINSSKEMSSYCDFPPPREFPNFMHNKHMKTYFHMYADHFNLKPHIRFKHTVQSVTKAEDFKETGEWIIKGQNEAGPFEGIYSAVMVCIGHHVFPHRPDFPGLSRFKGPITHTHDYKDFTGYENKKVVVVGIGNSGVDVSVELNRIADQVYLSTRRGTWVIHRVGPNGMPIDAAFLRRINYVVRTNIPASWVNYLVEEFVKFRFDHELYNLKPAHRITEQHININDELPNCILSGTVQIKNDIHEFTENGVRFKGEENEEYPIDAVIMATGYLIKFPFLDKSIIDTRDNKVELYKLVFPTDIEHNTLAFIGLIQPFGSVLPISDMQSRWAVQVFKGALGLPSKEEMLKDIEHEKRNSTYVKSQRHTIQVDYMIYMDMIGSFMGIKPDLLGLLFRDPRLFYTCLFGPCVPYQYRLHGINAWPGARSAIMRATDRIKFPLQTNKGKTLQRTKSSWLFIVKWVLPVVGMIIVIIVFIVAISRYMFRNESCQKCFDYINFFG